MVFAVEAIVGESTTKIPASVAYSRDPVNARHSSVEIALAFLSNVRSCTHAGLRDSTTDSFLMV